MLTPRDGGEKDEGELTGGKRLVRDLHRKFGHFADVIVADALYLNAPFLNTVLDCHMDAVIRLKDEERLIYKDAKGLFEKGEGRKDGFRRGRKRIEAWDTSDFEGRGNGPIKGGQVLRTRGEKRWYGRGPLGVAGDNQ